MRKFPKGRRLEEMTASQRRAWVALWLKRRGVLAVPGLTLLDDLAAYWALDEAGGPRLDAHGAFDMAEYDIFLEAMPGSVSAVGGVFGNAARPSGDGYCLSPLDPVFDVGADFTLSFWIWRDFGTGYSHWLAQNSSFMVHGPVGDYNDQVRFNLWGFTFEDAGSMDTTTSAILEDTWQHIAITKTAALVKVYVDGVADATTMVPLLPPLNSGAPLQLGSSFWGYGNATDTFDELAIWQRALSAAEVSQLYNGGGGLAYELF